MFGSHIYFGWGAGRLGIEKFYSRDSSTIKKCWILLRAKEFVKSACQDTCLLFKKHESRHFRSRVAAGWFFTCRNAHHECTSDAFVERCVITGAGCLGDLRREPEAHTWLQSPAATTQYHFAIAMHTQTRRANERPCTGSPRKKDYIIKGKGEERKTESLGEGKENRNWKNKGC